MSCVTYFTGVLLDHQKPVTSFGPEVLAVNSKEKKLQLEAGTRAWVMNETDIILDQSALSLLITSRGSLLEKKVETLTLLLETNPQTL